MPEAAGVAVGDLSAVAGIRRAAQAASALGPYDAVIHNAGVGSAAQRHRTADGGERTFTVNVLGPYLLTALMPLPPRLVYLASGLESAGRVHLDDLQWEGRAWDGMQAYSDSKLCDVLLAFAVARRYPQVRSNAVDPGWIKTKLGGPGATDELPVGAHTQARLATSDDPDAAITGHYLKWRRDLQANPAAYDTDLQGPCSPPARALPAPHCPTSPATARAAPGTSQPGSTRHATPAPQAQSRDVTGLVRHPRSGSAVLVGRT